MNTLADVVLLLHVGYVAFVVGGLVLILIGWPLGLRFVRNLWFRVAHLAAIAAVALEALAGIVCPLTALEAAWRGQASIEADFMQRALHAILYWDLPAWVFTLSYVAFTALVLVLFVALPPRSHHAFRAG